VDLLARLGEVPTTGATYFWRRPAVPQSPRPPVPPSPRPPVPPSRRPAVPPSVGGFPPFPFSAFATLVRPRRSVGLRVGMGDRVGAMNRLVLGCDAGVAEPLPAAALLG